VRFHIVAYDRVGNNATEDGTEYSAYTVIPEFSSSIILALLIMTTLVTAVILKRKRALSYKT
jgi:hypothetical protein